MENSIKLPILINRIFISMGIFYLHLQFDDSIFDFRLEISSSSSVRGGGEMGICILQQQYVCMKC